MSGFGSQDLGLGVRISIPGFGPKDLDRQVWVSRFGFLGLGLRISYLHLGRRIWITGLGSQELDLCV